jgi:putative aldouronate transport system substrate-binding protein
MNPISRRDFLKIAAASTTSGALAALPQFGGSLVLGQGSCGMDWDPSYPPFDKYDPPIEITMPWYGTSRTFIGDDGPTNNPMYNRILDNLGLKYMPAWQADGEAATQRMAAAIAAGELPDMFVPNGQQLAVLIQNDAIEDITDIFEATASDLVKEKKQYPAGDNWIEVKRGDRIYGVAFTYGPGYNIDNLGYIRQDFLDQLGLPMPETLDQLTETLRAFNQNGLCQFGINACKNLVTWYQSLDPVFGAFGTMPGRWLENGDGTLRYASLDPEVKEGLAVIRGWYEEGLIDPDFYTYSEGDAASGVASGRQGAFFAPWWIGGGLVKDLYEQFPDAKLSIMPAPAGPAGLRGRAGSGTRGNGVVYRKGLDPAVIEATIKELNWQMEMHVNWEMYQQYGASRNDHGFFEGYEWVFDENCNLIPGPLSPAREYEYMAYIGYNFSHNCYPDYQADIFRDMAAWLDKDEAELNQAQRYLLSNPVVLREIEFYNAVFDTLDTAILDRWLGPTPESMTQYMTDLNTMEQSVFTEIIIGSRPLEDFDIFVQDWMAGGGEQITADVNAWKASLSP